MATVLAAVDQARVRKPMYSEGGLLEEDIEPDYYQQTMLTEHEAVAMPTAMQIAPSEQTVHVSQVRGNK